MHTYKYAPDIKMYKESSLQTKNKKKQNKTKKKGKTFSYFFIFQVGLTNHKDITI